MNPDDPKLTAYALGELPAPKREALEKRLRDDPQARAVMEETATFARLLGEAFHAEPPPTALDPTQRAEVLKEARHGGKTVPFVQQPWFIWTLRLAAAFVALAALARLALGPSPRDARTATALPASRALAEKNGAPHGDARVIAASQIPGGASGSFSGNLSQAAGANDFLNLTNNKQIASGRFVPQSNAENTAPLNLTVQNAEAKERLADAAEKPKVLNEGSGAATQPVHTLAVRSESQIGFAGQNFGNGTPIDSRVAAAITAAPAAAPAEPMLTASGGFTRGRTLAKAATDASSLSIEAKDAPKKDFDSPALLQQPDFSSATLAAAVNRYVALGEEASAKELGELAAKGDPRLRERIGLLCRILYAPQDTETLRGPRFAGGALENSDEKKLALKKELSESNGTEVTQESFADYLAYCRAHGVFRTLPLPIPKATPASEEK